jgi:penicillin amidase
LDSPSRRRKVRRAARAAAVALAVLVVAGAACGFWLWGRTRASLAILDGEVALPGLSAPVAVERDALGVPTIRGRTRADVARATGFVHAQDRLFQMDLLRRRASGELSELFGKRALEVDRRARRHRLRRVAERAVAAASGDQRAVLLAYADGVNAGMAALRGKPFEYIALRAAPAPWRPEDSILVGLTMFILLNGEDDAYESALGVLHDTMPKAIAEFLSPLGTEWDAPLAGAPMATPAIPGAEVLDLRRLPAPASRSRAPSVERVPAGSNSFAVAGSRSVHGGAILANDMHLGHSVPNVWYRAFLVWGDGQTAHRAAGVTLPGVPLVVAGSNGHVAWGFTNSYGDWQDLVVLEVDGSDPDRYRAPGGPRRFEHVREVLHVKGGADEALDVALTVWGPVVDRDHLGRPRALRWTAHDERAVNLNLMLLERAGGIEEALRAANVSGIPPQNFLCADDRGRIGWTIAGVLPRRVGFHGRLPTSWADGERRWDGWREPGETPRIVDPPEGLLWTANARTVSGAELDLLGDGGVWLGARARQIRDDLRTREKWTERELLAVQLDDRALLLERWQRLLLDVLAPGAAAGDARRAEARRLVEAWGGRAAVESTGYRIVRSFRVATMESVLEPFDGQFRSHDPLFAGSYLTQAEGPVWRLVSERPQHLLNPRYGSWGDLLIAAADEAVRELGSGDLATHTWGERNTSEIRHPMSQAIPFAGRFLDMPADPLPGDEHMPRFQAPSAGASERLVVSPGRESEGIFEMPGGQSGHPLSSFYRAGHGAWVRGEPTPFLPGPAVHALTLVPSG